MWPAAASACHYQRLCHDGTDILFFLPLSRVPAGQSVKGRRPTYCISMKKIKRGQRGRGGLVSNSTICTTRYLLRTVVHPHVIYLHDPSPPLSRIKNSKSLLRDSPFFLRFMPLRAAFGFGRRRPNGTGEVINELHVPYRPSSSVHVFIRLARLW